MCRVYIIARVFFPIFFLMHYIPFIQGHSDSGVGEELMQREAMRRKATAKVSPVSVNKAAASIRITGQTSSRPSMDEQHQHQLAGEKTKK